MAVQRIGGRPSLTDLAYDALVEAIYDRTYPPGGPVSIDELADRLGISVTPVREALVRAASQRLLTRESNKGFSVAPLLTRREYRHLIELRRVLELHAIATAELRSEDIGRLSVALDRMRASGGSTGYADVKEFTRADYEFHAALVEACDNQFVVEAWNNLHHVMHTYRIYLDSGVFDSRDAIAEHEPILEAARAGDRAALTSSLRDHLGATENRLADRFPTTGDGV
jgi:DNA-binding GntR family transcriptional regulator